MSISKEPGYVYIFTNPSFREDWVKIGMSSRPVDVRSKELDSTVVPLPFEIYATMKTTKYTEAEKLIHKYIETFADFRIREDCEFFNVKPEEALEIFKVVASFIDDAVIEENYKVSMLGDDSSKLEIHPSSFTLACEIARFIHDMMTPAASILSLSKMAFSKLHDQDFVTSRLPLYLEGIQLESQEICNNLWVGQIPYYYYHGYCKFKERVNLRRLIERSKNKIPFSNSLGVSKDDIIIKDIPEIFINVNGNLFTAIFYNLLSNAIKFRNRKSIFQVCIKAAENEKTITICVEDYGIGIDPTLEDLIFSRKQSGIGVDLPLTKSILDDYNGNIVVSNYRNPTCFTITLPISLKCSLRILWIDDDLKYSLRKYCDFAESQGIHIDKCASFDESDIFLKSGIKYDCIIMDMDMMDVGISISKEAYAPDFCTGKIYMEQLLNKMKNGDLGWMKMCAFCNARDYRTSDYCISKDILYYIKTELTPVEFVKHLINDISK